MLLPSVYTDDECSVCVCACVCACVCVGLCVCVLSSPKHERQEPLEVNNALIMLSLRHASFRIDCICVSRRALHVSWLRFYFLIQSGSGLLSLTSTTMSTDQTRACDSSILVHIPTVLVFQSRSKMICVFVFSFSVCVLSVTCLMSSCCVCELWIFFFFFG